MFEKQVLDRVEITDSEVAATGGSGSGNTVTTGWYEAYGFHRFLAVGIDNDLGNGQKVTVLLESADDSSGTNNVTVGSAAVTNSSGSTLDTEAVVEVRDDDITEDDTHVRAVLYNDEATHVSAITLIRAEPIRTDGVLDNPVDGDSLSA